MATPKLNTGTTSNSPLGALRPAGSTGPAKQLKLKSASGATIAPKTIKKVAPKAAPKPAAPAPAPEAAPELTAAPAEEILVPQPEVEAAPAAAPEAAAATATVTEQPAADEEAARLAQEEYERQMEEYNRQMEEYNRQMAELQAAEAAAAATPEPQVDAEAAAAEAAQAAAVAQALVTEDAPDVPTPTEKIRAARNAKTKSSLSVAGVKKKAAKPADADSSDDDDSGMSEEEIAQREAYLRAIQEEEERTPIWKTVPFMVGSGLLVATIAICTVMVVQKQQENARIKAHVDYTNTLLRRAQEINMKGVESVADATKKQVDVSCSMKDAKALMEVVVDPFVKGENDKPRYGARAEGVAQNACLLLGLAAEQDPAIRDMIFETMGKQCVKIKPSLFRWLLQRIAISDAEGVNANLKKLAKVVTEKKTAKPWNKKSELLAQIWECIGLRVTQDDTKEILSLLNSDIADAMLMSNLCICLDNIITMMDDKEAKAQLGNEIFTQMPEKLRNNVAIAGTLARACSTAALNYYKGELSSEKGWTGAAPAFLGAWGSDDILEYVLEKKEEFKDQPKIQATINDVIGTIMKQDRPRSVADGEKLLNMCFKTPFGDTSGIQDLINKTDDMSTLYVGDSHPDLPKLKAQLKELEVVRKQKLQIIRMLRGLSDHEWVVSLLNKYIADKDENVQYDAKKALEQTRANAVHANQMREAYKQRNKN